MADMDPDMTSEKYDWFAGIFIAIIIGITLGYAWAWHHGNIRLERAHEQGYEAAVDELMVVVKEDICQ